MLFISRGLQRGTFGDRGSGYWGRGNYTSSGGQRVVFSQGGNCGQGSGATGTRVSWGLCVLYTMFFVLLGVFWGFTWDGWGCYDGKHTKVTNRRCYNDGSFITTRGFRVPHGGP